MMTVKDGFERVSDLSQGKDAGALSPPYVPLQEAPVVETILAP